MTCRIRFEEDEYLSPHSTPGRYTLHHLSVAHDKHASDQNVRNPFGILSGVVKGGTVDHSFRVKHGNIGIGSHLEPTFGLDAEPLGRHQTHRA